MSQSKLRVCESEKDDIGKGIARLSEQTLHNLGINLESVIEIISKRTTSALALVYVDKIPTQDVIKLDSYIRRNAGVELDDNVTVKLATVAVAVNITLSPVDMRLNVDEEFTNFVKNRLLERTAVEGDTIPVLMRDHLITFTVCNTSPKGVVKLTKESKVTILNEPFSSKTVLDEQKPSPLVASTEALKDIPDETFEKLIEVVITHFFFDWEQFKAEEVSKETGTNQELVQSTITFLKGLILNNLSGDLSLNRLKHILLEDYKYTQSKIDIVTKHYEANKDDLRFTLMFRFIQDFNSKLEATTKSGYFPAIACRLTELKDLYGHVLDVTTSTRVDVAKLTELVKSNIDTSTNGKKGEEVKKKKLW